MTSLNVSCSTIKIKKDYNWRLIGCSYLVLGTRSAAKFEKVPGTSEQGTSKAIPGSLLEDGGSPGQGRPPLPCTPLRICGEKLCLLKIRLVHRSRIIMGLKKGIIESGRKQKMIRIMRLLMYWVKK